MQDELNTKTNERKLLRDVIKNIIQLNDEVTSHNKESHIQTNNLEYNQLKDAKQHR